jgi:glycerol-3-phosphate dehydrogenase subunit C
MTAEPPIDPSTMSLRTGTDDCVKCSACDLECPVAAVDDDFPGPKFQGPEQWRLASGTPAVDESIEACSNCMRCDDACPSGVPLGEMHNRARGEHVAERGLSRKAIRDRLLANYGRLAGLASRVPRLSNALVNNTAVRWLLERGLGITAEREFPRFATTTFSDWFDARGGAQVTDPDRRVAYFHGDYANYNTPAVGKALVRVFEAFGYEVVVPPQRCSGTPMVANGALEDARRAARFNVETLTDYVAAGYDVVCSCTSCAMALRKTYPELYDFEGVPEVRQHTYEAVEFLRLHADLSSALAAAEVGEADPLLYHTPCHARSLGLANRTETLFDRAAAGPVTDLGDACSGIAGSYGWKAERYETSMAVGAELFEAMHAGEGETGMTECPTCAMQMAHGSDADVVHPLQVIAERLDLDQE